MAGPVEVTTRAEHRELLATAGFCNIEEHDVTADLDRTVERWLDYASGRETELREAMGDDLFNRRQRDRLGLAAAIAEGVLRRSLFIAETPKGDQRQMPA